MLAAGKHVLVEKPLATTVAEALLIVAAAAAGATPDGRFSRALASAVHGRTGYVERGELGAPVMAYARLSDTIHVPTYMLSWSGQSGPEWFLFPHTMDLIRWLFHREPIEVYAKGTRGVLEAGGSLLGRHPGPRRVRGRRHRDLRDVVDRARPASRTWSTTGCPSTATGAGSR